MRRASAAGDAAVSSGSGETNHPDVINDVRVETGGGRPKLEVSRSQRPEAAGVTAPSALTSAARGLFSLKGMEWRLSVAGCMSQPAVLDFPDTNPAPPSLVEVGGRGSKPPSGAASGLSEYGRNGVDVTGRATFRSLWGSGIILILPDGGYHSYDHPVLVGAVLEHFSTACPNHFVVEVSEDVAGRPSLEMPGLSPAHMLTSAKVYALHPNKMRKKRFKRPTCRDAFRGLASARPTRPQELTSEEEDGWIEVTADSPKEVENDSPTARERRKDCEEDGRLPPQEDGERAVPRGRVHGRSGRGDEEIKSGASNGSSTTDESDGCVERGEVSRKAPGEVRPGLRSGGWFSGRLGGDNGSGVQVPTGSWEVTDESERSAGRGSWSLSSGLGLSVTRMSQRSFSGTFSAVDGGEGGAISGPALCQLAGVERVKSNQVADLAQMMNERDVKSFSVGSGKVMHLKWEPGLGSIKESRSWNSRKISPKLMRKVDRVGGNAKLRLMKSRLKSKVVHTEVDVELSDAT